MRFDIEPIPAGREPADVLAAFRKLLAETSWADQTPDTMFAPIRTPIAQVREFGDQLGRLYLAHLAVLRALLDGGPFTSTGARYAEMAGPVRDFYLDWPELADDLDRGLLDDPERLSNLFGRPDVVLAEDGPKTVETNFDTAAAGQERPDDMWRIATELFEIAPSLQQFGRPLWGLRDYFEERAGGRPSHFYWLMKDDPVARREMDPLLAVLNAGAELARHSLHYPGDDPAGLATDQLVGYLHRSISIFTVNKDRDRFGRLIAGLAGRAPTLTVPLGLSVVSSKVFLAWLSDPTARPIDLPADQVAAIDQLVPWTRVLSLVPDRELEAVRDQPVEFVLKKADSYQATEVHFGWQLGPTEWNALLERCRADPLPWIIQRRVRPKLFRLTEHTDEGVRERETGLACCPYLYGGRIRGLETWITPAEPDLTMISRMQFVPHFIDAG